MCPSGTGRFIADSWFSDEPLPAAYKVPAAARVRASGGVGGKKVDRQAVEEHLREADIPQAGSASPPYRDSAAFPNDMLVVSNNRHAIIRHLRAVSAIC
jgi:hypothetical protein